MKKILSTLTAFVLTAGFVLSASATAVQANTSDKDMQKLRYPNTSIGAYDAPSYGLIEAGQKFTKVSTSHLGGIILGSDGVAYTWGNNTYGQIGIGKMPGCLPCIGTVNITDLQNKYLTYSGGLSTLNFFTNPKAYEANYKAIGYTPALTEPTKIVDVAGGYEFMAALDEKGRVWAWGYNGYHIAGKPTGNVAKSLCKYDFPQLVNGLPNNIVKIVASQGIACFERIYAIDANGGLWAWGSNCYGLQGVGNTKTDADYMATPHQSIFPAGTKIVDVQAGAEHTVALDSDGNIWTWGNSCYGYLGDNKASRTQPAMISLPGNVKAKGISAMGYASLAVDYDGNAYQWGYVHDIGTIVKTPTLVKIAASEIARAGYTPKAQSVSTGYKTYYIIDQYGRSWAWGWNIFAGLGMEGGAAENVCVSVKEAYQYPQVIGDGDTQPCNNKQVKTPAEGLQMNKTYKTYGKCNVHPTVYDLQFNEGPQSAKVEYWKKYALQAMPKLAQISADLYNFAAIDADGNAYAWSYADSGSLAFGWDFKKGYGPIGNARDGMYYTFSYEVLPMLGYPDTYVPKPVDPPVVPPVVPDKEGSIQIIDILLDGKGNPITPNPVYTSPSMTGKLDSFLVIDVETQIRDYTNYQGNGNYCYDEKRTIAEASNYDDATDTITAAYKDPANIVKIYYALDTNGNKKPDYLEGQVVLQYWLKDKDGKVIGTEPAVKVTFFADGENDGDNDPSRLRLNVSYSYMINAYYPMGTAYPQYSYDWTATARDPINNFSHSLNMPTYISTDYGIEPNVPVLNVYFGIDTKDNGYPDYYTTDDLKEKP